METANVDRRDMTYLYNDGTNYVLMDEKDFEQIELPPHLMGDGRFLLENTTVQVSFHEGEALFAELPVSVDLRIEHTDPGLQGDRSTGGTKPATLETGAEIQVPLFLETGNVVRVDTRDGSYLSRVSNWFCSLDPQPRARQIQRLRVCFLFHQFDQRKVIITHCERRHNQLQAARQSIQSSPARSGYHF